MLCTLRKSSLSSRDELSLVTDGFSSCKAHYTRAERLSGGDRAVENIAEYRSKKVEAMNLVVGAVRNEAKKCPSS